MLRFAPILVACVLPLGAAAQEPQAQPENRRTPIRLVSLDGPLEQEAAETSLTTIGSSLVPCLEGEIAEGRARLQVSREGRVESVHVETPDGEPEGTDEDNERDVLADRPGGTLSARARGCVVRVLRQARFPASARRNVLRVALHEAPVGAVRNAGILAALSANDNNSLILGALGSPGALGSALGGTLAAGSTQPHGGGLVGRGSLMGGTTMARPVHGMGMRTVAHGRFRIRQAEGALSPLRLSRVMRRRQAALRRCGERTERPNQGVRGVVRIEATVRPNGTIQAARLVDNSTGSQRVAECLRHQVRRWRFESAEQPTRFTLVGVWNTNTR